MKLYRVYTDETAAAVVYQPRPARVKFCRNLLPELLPNIVHQQVPDFHVCANRSQNMVWEKESRMQMILYVEAITPCTAKKSLKPRERNWSDAATIWTASQDRIMTVSSHNAGTGELDASVILAFGKRRGKRL